MNKDRSRVVDGSHSKTVRTKPELLAPAGNWECAQAAVANGADAIYFGLDRGFNARDRAANFSMDELPKLIEFLHQNHVRGYVTLNTLGFSDELDSISEVIQVIAAAGTDAVLVQDLGVARLVHSIAPDMEVHASTQMTMTSAENIEVASQLGISRVVLARELSIAEIKKITAASEMPVEAFVHGALCVAYSGQCLTSESLGGRSANRGQCAQACRLPYELICDDKDVDTKDQQYLLSPQDLAAFDLVPEMIDAGVCSLKIEGRLKTPEYVANIVSHYRSAIDEAMKGTPHQFSDEEVVEMELSFSRGFSHGWLDGCDHKALVPAITSAKQGVRVGEVAAVLGSRIRIEVSRELRAGDGIVFAGDRLTGEEQGARIFSLKPASTNRSRANGERVVEVTLARDDFDFDLLYQGQAVWKNDDPKLTKRLRKTFRGEIHGRALQLNLNVRVSIKDGIEINGELLGVGSFSVSDQREFETATKHPISQQVLETQLGRLGGTGFQLNRLNATIQGSPMVPHSVLGALRKRLVEQCQLLVASHDDSARTINKDGLVQLRAENQTISDRMAQEFETSALNASDTTSQVLGLNEHAKLVVMCRSLQQVRAVSEQFAGNVELYSDFQDPREYREATAIANSNDRPIFLATPRIQKPGEMGLFRAMQKHPATGFLVRNLAGLHFFKQSDRRCRADFSLNAANELSVAWLLQQGAELVTAAYDLNRDQIFALVKDSVPSLLEVVIHQHMPMFHMEHCVFCAMLSPGTNKSNCGRPCDRHQVKLRDRIGVEHPLKADIGCRNTLFNATAQSGAEVVGPLLDAGVRHFRVELLEQESDKEILSIVQLYDQLLRNEIKGAEVWRTLRAVNCLGVTRGTLDEQRNPLAII